MKVNRRVDLKQSFSAETEWKAEFLRDFKSYHPAIPSTKIAELMINNKARSSLLGKAAAGTYVGPMRKRR
jgi:hypothetical protein